MTIGKRIKERREELGIEVSEVAKHCGVSDKAAYAWESGSSKTLKPANLVAVAEFLKLRIKWLAIGQGPRERVIDIEELDPEEAALVEAYRLLDRKEQIAMKTTVESLAAPRRRKQAGL